MLRSTTSPTRIASGIVASCLAMAALGCSAAEPSATTVSATSFTTASGATGPADRGTDPSASGEPEWPWVGPQPAANPGLSTGPAPMMHDDPGSSDVARRPGPGSGPVEISTIHLDAICPAVLIGADLYLMALCTGFDFAPVVHLLDPDGTPLASLGLEVGNLFAGVYGYLDPTDRLVMVDGSNDVLRIARVGTGPDAVLEVVERTPLDDVLGDEAVTSVAPGYDGRVWFATDGGTVGAVDTGSGAVDTVRLVGPNGDPERVANSISTSPRGVGVATDHALYLLDPTEVAPLWRRPYDRGPARKPGQLSHGTGSSPTFFGPNTGHEYLAMVDNAEPEVHLLVVSVDGEAGRSPGQVVCSPVVLEGGGPGSENSPIGSGRTVVVASTYGYVYPAAPPDAGPAVPETAPVAGGLTRVDVRADGSGCDVVWNNQLRSAAVPKLSLVDGHLWTVLRRPLGEGNEGTDWYDAAVLSIDNGQVLAAHALPFDTGDPLQLAGSIGPDGVIYQGTLGPILRIAPGPGDS